jgi:hypothetical protein
MSRIEEHSGCIQTIGHIWQTAYRGVKRVDQQFKLTMVATDPTRMAQCQA